MDVNRTQLSILTILYDLTALMCGETRVQPLLDHMLLRLMHHTAFPWGVYVTPLDHMAEDTTTDTVRVRIETAIGSRTLAKHVGSTFTVPQSFVTGESALIEGCELPDSLFSECLSYAAVLRLSVPDAGTFLLFTSSTAGIELPLDQMFAPVMSNLSMVLRLCRTSEEYTQQLSDRRKHADTLTELIVQQMGEGIFSVDREGTCTLINPSCAKLFGYDDPQSMLGKNMHDLTHHTKIDGTPFPRQECPIGQSMRSGTPVLIDSEVFWRADGNSFPAEYRARPISVDGVVRGAVVSFTDLTARRLVEAKTIQASKLATLGEMSTAISHELNQPLTIIGLTAGNLMMKMEKTSLDPSYLSNKLERIVTQTKRASDIINHMRMFGRKAVDSPQPVDPKSAVEGALSLIGQQLRVVNIEVSLELPETCRAVVGHIISIEQVILNLLVNARDAILSNDGTGPMHITLTIDDTTDDAVRIIVQDTGGGIPEGVVGRVFEPFFTTKEMGKGTGLGLSISYGIIHDMGGTLEAENVTGGARFTITLPAAHGADQSQEGST